MPRSFSCTALAAAAVVVAAVVAAVAAVVAEQQDQDDDPPPVVAAKTAKTIGIAIHTNDLLKDIGVSPVHSMICTAAVLVIGKDQFSNNEPMGAKV